MTGRHQRGLVAAIATLLATAPLMAVFDGLGWLGSCAVVIAAIAGMATLARAFHAPAWVQLVAMLAGWMAALTMLFSGGERLFLFIPNGGTFAHFDLLLSNVASDIRSHSTPVPALDSLVFVTALGVGLVAVVVDLLVVSLRRPAMAGLPMLAIYSVPVAVSLDSVPMLLFGIGALGYLWLLGSDNMDRVRRFGRRFSGDGRDVEPWEPSPLAAAGRRLALIGVVVAVALPLAVPGMTSGLVDRFGPGVGGGAGSGGSGGSGQVDLFAELYGQLNQDETIELVRVTTEDRDPFYLRLATADQIHDTGFQPSAPRGEPVSQVATAPVRAGTTRQEYLATVELSDAYSMSMAPTYTDLAEMVGLDDEWLYDPHQQIVYAGQGDRTPPAYEFTYLRPEYDAAALRRAQRLPASHEIQAGYAHAPEIAEVRQLLDSLVDPDDPPYDQVRTILGLFSRDNGFRYDLATGPATDAPAIVDFLENRAGFCVQYAAAMAWLVRSIDMPARVAFGFTRGRNAGDNARVMTNRNLHAWTEVYFEGFGWVPFDPTPGTAVAGSASPGWAPNPQAPADNQQPDQQLDPGDDTGASPGPGTDEELHPDFLDDTGFGGGGTTTDSQGPWWLLGAVAVLLVLLLQPALYRVLLRRRRLAHRSGALAGAAPASAGQVVAADGMAAHKHRAHRAWAELIDTMVDVRLPVDPTETPRATAQRLTSAVGPDTGPAESVALLGQAEERARYARDPLVGDGLAEAMAVTRHALLREASRWTRLRARFMPPSTLLRWRTAITDVSGRWAVAAGRATEALARISPRRLLRAAR